MLMLAKLNREIVRRGAAAPCEADIELSGSKEPGIRVELDDGTIKRI